MKTPGAITTGISMPDLVTAWLRSHRNVAIQSLSNLLKNWLASLMTTMVLGIAMGLPLLLYILLVNVLNLSENFDGKPRISIYLNKQLEEADIKRVLTVVNEHSNTQSFRYISPEEALADFQLRSNFVDVLNTLASNPLPGVVELIPSHTEPVKLRSQIMELEKLQEVDTVLADLVWIERLFSFIKLAKSVVILLASILGLGVLLVLGNTIRLSIENRRNEIEVVKLVGGTNSFVKRPFLYLGFWYGIGGAISSWFLVHICLLFLSGPVELIAQSYRDHYALVGLTFLEGLVLFAVSSGLGLLGAVLAVHKHLRIIDSSL